jgi:hypothetical protein
VSQHSPKPLLGTLLGESCKGCGCIQYDCAFTQNLIIVLICSCISMPFFRCKLRNQYQIKVTCIYNFDHVACDLPLQIGCALQGNIVFDCLACLLCGGLAPLQEFREVPLVTDSPHAPLCDERASRAMRTRAHGPTTANRRRPPSGTKSSPRSPAAAAAASSRSRSASPAPPTHPRTPRNQDPLQNSPTIPSHPRSLNPSRKRI